MSKNDQESLIIRVEIRYSSYFEVQKIRLSSVLKWRAEFSICRSSLFVEPNSHGLGRFYNVRNDFSGRFLPRKANRENQRSSRLNLRDVNFDRMKKRISLSCGKVTLGALTPKLRICLFPSNPILWRFKAYSNKNSFKK